MKRVSLILTLLTCVVSATALPVSFVQHQPGNFTARFGAAMAEILGDRLLEPAFVLGNGGAQPPQPIQPFPECRRRLCPRQLMHAAKVILEGVLAAAFYRLVHRGVRAVPGPEADLCRMFWQEHL